jgi:hypothetical protein
MKILILTSDKHRSPRVLGESLYLQLVKNGVDVVLSFNLPIFRLVNPKGLINFLKWIWTGLRRFLFKKFLMLNDFDVIIISECIPNAFIKSYYDFTDLKESKAKICLYEVYDINLTPSQFEKFSSSVHLGIDYFDYYLSGSKRTEIPETSFSSQNSYYIGIFLNNFRTPDFLKKDLAILDFPASGYEEFRKNQILFLKDCAIPFIELNGEYTHYELRFLYAQAKYYFLSGPEAFGLPISECLFNGTIVFTPDITYPTAWKKDGELPSNFVVYNGFDDLKRSLDFLKTNFDAFSRKSLDMATAVFPEHFFGNLEELNRFMGNLSCKG